MLCVAFFAPEVPRPLRLELSEALLPLRVERAARERITDRGPVRLRVEVIAIALGVVQPDVL